MLFRLACRLCDDHLHTCALQVAKGAFPGTPAAWAVLALLKASPSLTWVTSRSPHANRQSGAPRPWTCSKRAGPFTYRTTRSTSQPMRYCCAACTASSQACCSCTTACACTGRCCRYGKCGICGCRGMGRQGTQTTSFCCSHIVKVPRHDLKACTCLHARGFASTSKTGLWQSVKITMNTHYSLCSPIPVR